MSLQIWLPLNGNLNNQGLSDITVTNVGATVNNSGKIGKCYYFNGSSNRIACSSKSFSYPMSICAWFKPTYIEGTGTQYWLSYNTATGGTVGHAIGIGTYGAKLSTWYGGTVKQFSSTLNNNTWYHITVTITEDKTVKTYLDGTLIDTTSFTSNHPNSVWFTIGARCNSSTGGVGGANYYYKGYINDVRLYDHALSPLEVKHIAQGLILHYPLNNGGCGPSNLVKNGFGELGSENWSSSSNISTTEIPSGQSDIKASFFDNTTKEYIKIYHNHNYKFSIWIKARGSSAVTYPSILPYDIDKKFISHFNCTDGFNLNTMTTLKQQLKSGDTKIYVNDLSQWNANSGHHFNSVAIFSYADSTGHTYPDGTYTQNCPRFCSGSGAKTNLDKTNNVITLSSTYSGPTMPIGTKVCATADGSVYYYPFGSISLSSIQDWTYKEKIISSNVARLKYAKTIRYFTWDSNYTAGIKLQDVTVDNVNDNIEYDCSGLGNNGTKQNNVTYVSDTPRYDASTVFNGNDTYIAVNTKFSPFFKGGDTPFTFSFWVYRADSTRAILFGDYGLSGSISFNIELTVEHILRLYWGGTPDYKPSSAALTLNAWSHIGIVYTGSSILFYINGELKGTYSSALSTKSKTSGNYYLGRDNRTGTTALNGNLSDFRIYATALSAEDIQNLYTLGAAIDSSNNLYTYQLNET